MLTCPAGTAASAGTAPRTLPKSRHAQRRGFRSVSRPTAGRDEGQKGTLIRHYGAMAAAPGRQVDEPGSEANSAVSLSRGWLRCALPGLVQVQRGAVEFDDARHRRRGPAFVLFGRTRNHPAERLCGHRVRIDGLLGHGPGLEVERVVDAESEDRHPPVDATPGLGPDHAPHHRLGFGGRHPCEWSPPAPAPDHGITPDARMRVTRSGPPSTTSPRSPDRGRRPCRPRAASWAG